MHLLFKSIVLFVLLAMGLQLAACSPLLHNSNDLQIAASNIDSRLDYRAAPNEEQTIDPEKPIVDVQVTQNQQPETPPKQTQQTVQQQQEEIPTKQQQTQVLSPPTDSVSTGGSAGAVESGRTEAERNRANGGLVSTTTCSTCGGLVKAKPDFSKAIATAVKGNAIAAAATVGLASPVLIKSAKIAALASLIPVKLAAKGAIIGTLIAKPIIIKSAIASAIATKVSHLLVGKPIAIGANLLAGIEALKAKAKAKKTTCLSSTCTTVSGVSSGSSVSDSSSSAAGGAVSDTSSTVSSGPSTGISTSVKTDAQTDIQPQQISSSVTSEGKLQ